MTGQLYLNEGQNFICVFGNMTNGAAQIVNSTMAICQVPDYGVIATVPMYLQYQGAPWGGSFGLPFQFVDCNSAQSCSNCLLLRSFGFPNCG